MNNLKKSGTGHWKGFGRCRTERAVSIEWAAVVKSGTGTTGSQVFRTDKAPDTGTDTAARHLYGKEVPEYFEANGGLETVRTGENTKWEPIERIEVGTSVEGMEGVLTIDGDVNVGAWFTVSPLRKTRLF